MRKKTKQILIITLLVTICFLAGYIFLFNYVRAKNEKASEMNNAINDQGEIAAKLSSMKTLLSETEKERRQLESYFIGREGLVAFVEDIEALGRLSGAKLSIANLSTESIREGLATSTAEYITASIEAYGSWASVFRLGQLIESIPASISMERVSFNRDGKDKSRSSWTAVFDIRAIKLK